MIKPSWVTHGMKWSSTELLLWEEWYGVDEYRPVKLNDLRDLITIYESLCQTGCWAVEPRELSQPLSAIFPYRGSIELFGYHDNADK